MTVFIVDDDPSVRDSLGLLLGVQGYRIALFSNGADLLNAWRPDWLGCLLIDIRMPGMDGLALQRELAERHSRLPVIIMTGHGDVDLARRAFKADAFDFLEKPLEESKLINAINDAFVQVGQLLTESQGKERSTALVAALTPREREVMQLVVSGKHNREVAELLGISVRTVEVHKARLMSKLNVDNVADLVRTSMRA